MKKNFAKILQGWFFGEKKRKNAFTA